MDEIMMASKLVIVLLSTVRHNSVKMSTLF